jgi:hypothetical protein
MCGGAEPRNTPIVTHSLRVHVHMELRETVFCRDVVGRLMQVNVKELDESSAVARMRAVSYHFLRVNDSIALILSAVLRSKVELDLFRRQVELALQLNLVARRRIRRLRSDRHVRAQTALRVVLVCVALRQHQVIYQH